MLVGSGILEWTCGINVVPFDFDGLDYSLYGPERFQIEGALRARKEMLFEPSHLRRLQLIVEVGACENAPLAGHGVLLTSCGYPLTTSFTC